MLDPFQVSVYIYTKIFTVIEVNYFSLFSIIIIGSISFGVANETRQVLSMFKLSLLATNHWDKQDKYLLFYICQLADVVLKSLNLRTYGAVLISF